MRHKRFNNYLKLTWMEFRAFFNEKKCYLILIKTYIIINIQIYPNKLF